MTLNDVKPLYHHTQQCGCLSGHPLSDGARLLGVDRIRRYSFYPQSVKRQLPTKHSKFYRLPSTIKLTGCSAFSDTHCKSTSPFKACRQTSISATFTLSVRHAITYF